LLFDQFAETLQDVPDSEGLYSLVSKRGFYFKNYKGYDGLAGATVQITKNFATLGDMLGRIQTLRVNSYLKMPIFVKDLIRGKEIKMHSKQIRILMQMVKYLHFVIPFI